MNNQDTSKTSKEQRLERERKQRRDAIIETAMRFFIKEGYEQTMVEQIAKEAGYTKATIYNYFDSKEELYIGAVARTYENLFEVLDTYLSQPGVNYELRSMGDAYLTFVERYPDQAGLFESGRLGLVIRGLIKKEEANELLAESEKEFRHHQLKVERLMTDVIVETMKASGVEGKVDPFSVIMALSTIGGAIRELVVRGMSGEEPREKTREYLNVLFNIIDRGLKNYGN
ncbi:MAG: TetR/AcrR family transcriptional regulator [Candidatus Thorarchaeota archaeon]|nr:MAG: TetR/AcrR family transcriptional regulator [Candidatus Thorarchaeota archaeon]